MATLQVSHDIKADPHVVWSIVIGMDDWVDVIEAIESEQVGAIMDEWITTNCSA